MLKVTNQVTILFYAEVQVLVYIFHPGVHLIDKIPAKSLHYTRHIARGIGDWAH